MTEDSPEIVNLEDSPELSAFLSEAELAAGEAAAPAADAIAPATSPAAAMAESEPSIPAAPLQATEPNVTPLRPVASRPVEEPAADGDATRSPVTAEHAWLARLAVSDPPGRQPTSSDARTPQSPGKADTADEPAPPRAAHPPATVTEFPVRPHTPPAVALPSLPAGPASLVELIERRGGFDWREAVAVIHQICLYLRDHAPQSPILLDPRTIQITDRGEVRLLSGQSSSDPLVIQVGRLLRTMLMGKEAPPELRLLLAQATFELPIFESIEDVDRALAQLNKLDDPGPAGLALLRAVAAPLPPPSEAEVEHRPAPIRSILPARDTAGRRARRHRRMRSLFGEYGSPVAVIFGAIALIGVLLATRPALLFPADDVEAQPADVRSVESAASSAARAAATPGATPVGSSSGTTGSPTGSAPVSPAGSAPGSTIGSPASPQPRQASAGGSDRTPNRQASTPPSRPPSRTGTVTVTPLTGTSLAEVAARLNDARPTASNDARPTATRGETTTSRRSSGAPTPRETERFATSMLEKGQMAEASMAFDAMVMANPLYEPRTSELTPEALAAFRSSQRAILPGTAQSRYDRATAALAAGDPDWAVALGKESLAIIDRRLGGQPAQLREQVNALITQASEAAAIANDIVYTEADRDVTPPVQLTRQLPVTSPVGVPPSRVGWLDMIIGRNGQVEFVKLNTPLNRHHERMIVSPAKAWQYRPATKNGRPVRYRITVKVNLPESGTD